MKQNLILFGVGLINLLVFFLFFKYVTFSISYGVLLVSFTLFLSAFFSRKINQNDLMKTLIISLPIFLPSILFITEAKSLWPILPYYLLITYLGVLLSKKKHITAFAFLILSVQFCLYIIPQLLFNSLTIETNHTKLSYSFDDLLTNKKVDSTEKPSEIIVLSFFNTWCHPCIKEFPELQNLKDLYKDKKVRVVLVCAGEMDTKEKVLEFYKKRKLNFDLWYDENSKIYKENHLSGVPSLIILNKDGKIVHKHSGYNEGMKLDKQLEKIIDDLL